MLEFPLTFRINKRSLFENPAAFRHNEQEKHPSPRLLFATPVTLFFPAQGGCDAESSKIAPDAGFRTI
ncbi:hypothetical protein ACWTQY_28005, partial [Klebsiella pneumoniae]